MKSYKYKYVMQFEIVVLANSDEEAKQIGNKIASKQTKRYDNQCIFQKLWRIVGLTSKEIKLK